MPVLRLLPDLEEGIRKIPGVTAVSVVTGPDAQPTEVHVLATPGKAAKQIVRDIQSLAAAQFSIELDHRIVSIVQLGSEEGVPEGSGSDGEQTPEISRRPLVGAVAVRTSAGEVEVEVQLSAGGIEFAGQALGPASPTHRPRVVAAATLAALRELLGLRCEIESAQLVRAGTRQIALSVLSLGVPRMGEQILTGSAPVRGDEADAVARSVLDALNRQLTG